MHKYIIGLKFTSSHLMSSFKIKIVYYSAGSLGKPVPIQRYFGKGFSSNYQINIGVNVYVREYKYKSDDIATLSFWDIGEQEKLRFFRKALLKGAFGAVFGFDLSDRSSFEDVKKLLINVRSVTLKKVPFILIGNTDSGSSTVDRGEIQSYIEKEGGIYLETSDEIEEQLNMALNELARVIIETIVLAH